MYNFINIEDSLNLLPFPKEIKDILDVVKTDFSKYNWNCVGLPIDNAIYSLTNKELYFEYHPDGKFELKKTEISGNCTIGAYFINPNKELNNYSVVFNLLFLKGELVETTMVKLEPQDPKVFDEMANNLTKKLQKTVKMQKSCFYKYLYFPYAFVVRWTIWILMKILDLIYRSLKWISTKLTPI